MDNPFFSVIIPTYNRVGLVEKAISSVLNQSYPNFELIVVDDGSTDNTEKIIGLIDNPKLRYFKICNSERGAARNYGIDKAKGRYVTFLDSDDLYYTWHLSHAYESLNEYNFPKFFHLGYELKNENGNIRTKIKNLQNDDVLIFVKGNPLSCIGVFIDKSITDEYRFNEDRDLAGSEDWELWIRISSRYGLKVDNRISTVMIEHDARSVKNFNEQKLLRRKLLSLEFAFKDENVIRVFNKHFREIESFCDSYISLHLVLSGKTSRGWKYLVQAIRSNYMVLFNRRFLAILKHSFLNLFSN